MKADAQPASAPIFYPSLVAAARGMNNWFLVVGYWFLVPMAFA
jgi:hypothetical protein